MTTIYQTVEVEVDVSDLDEDQLVEACQELGYSVVKLDDWMDTNGMPNDLNELAELYRNKSPLLMESLRTFIQTYTGRVMP